MTAKTLAIVDISARADGRALVWDAAAAVHKYTSGIGASLPEAGWIDDTGETWTYDSADAPTFAFTITGDKSAKYQAGQRLKLTQTTVKYFIVTKVAVSGGTTTITVYGGTDYTLANAAISVNYHSPVKAPFGFPLDPAKWTVSLAYAGGAQSNATAGTIYNLSNIVVPIGAWNLRGGWTHYASGSTAAQCAIRSGLSGANNTFSDVQMTRKLTGYIFTNTAEIRGGVEIHKLLALTAKTTYYLNISSIQNAGTTQISIDDGGLVEAICAYL